MYAVGAARAARGGLGVNALDLRREAAALRDRVGDLPDLDDRERQAAIATWRGRMVQEHASARVFGALVGQAMAAGLDAARTRQLAEFACEELDHARRCAAVVVVLGGEASAPWPPLPRVPDHAEAEPLEALLRNVISVCCMAETVAVALIRAECLEIGPLALRAWLERILADEVGHARFGWALLESLDPLPAELADRLARYAEVALNHLAHHELAHLPAHGGLGPRAAAVGVCSGFAARALLGDTVDRVIVPGLARHGVVVRPVAWREIGLGG